MTAVLSLIAVALYLVASERVFRWMQSIEEDETRQRLLSALWVAFGALVAHCAALLPQIFGGTQINVGLGTSLSLVSAVVVGLFLIANLREPLTALGLLIFPVAALSVAVGWALPGESYLPSSLPRTAVVHMTLALISYGIVALAVAQAILLSVQERKLRHKQPPGFFQALPPLETMERLLFSLIYVGFALLTLTIITGGVFAKVVFGRPLAFTHHIIFAVLAWISVGTLTGGRIIAGWRGKVAVTWTITSFVLLVLAYFGTKFVLTVFLGR